jgi:predicted RNA polymerase sigma factor
VPKAIEAVWTIESTRLIAAIARVTHDIGIAEELAPDAPALVARPLKLWLACHAPSANACARPLLI